MLVVYLVFWSSRFLFYSYNSDIIGEIETGHLFSLAVDGLRFDLSVIMVFNALFIVMRFLPFSFVYNRKYILATNIIFIFTNTLLLLANLVDIPLFRFTGSRMKLYMLLEFLKSEGTFSLLFHYFAEYWWLYILGFFSIFLTFYVAFRAKPTPLKHTDYNDRLTVAVKCVILLAVGFLAYRGYHGRSLDVAPLPVNDAAINIKNGPEINIVLNTPFCLINTSAKPTIREYKFFTDAELDSLRNSLLVPSPTKKLTGKNIVMISIESGGTIWSDTLSVYRDEIKKSAMPFIDSLARESLCVRHVFSTGTLTIDGLTNLYVGIPSSDGFIYITSEYVNNKVDAPVKLLAEEGYDTKFYYGGYKGAYTIDKLATSMGFRSVTDCTTFPNQSYDDRAWGIFDHALGQWAAKDMTSLKQPFFAGWHTLNPHKPFTCPQDWNAANYKYELGSVERGAEYEDRAIQAFFNEARQQPWYDNTIFIITADHGCRDFANTPLVTPYIQSHIFFIVYDPSGELPTGIIEDKIMSQFDIAPTVLGLAGYNKPHIALGKDIFSEEGGQYAINFLWENCQIISNQYLVRMDADMKQIKAVFDITTDLTLKKPLGSYDTDEVNKMVKWGRALMQDYSRRMKENRLSVARQ